MLIYVSSIVDVMLQDNLARFVQFHVFFFFSFICICAV